MIDHKAFEKKAGHCFAWNLRTTGKERDRPIKNGRVHRFAQQSLRFNSNIALPDWIKNHHRQNRHKTPNFEITQGIAVAYKHLW